MRLNGDGLFEEWRDVPVLFDPALLQSLQRRRRGEGGVTWRQVKTLTLVSAVVTPSLFREIRMSCFSLASLATIPKTLFSGVR